MTDASAPRHDSALKATLAGIQDALRRRPELPLPNDDRLDGRQVLVTGATRGLGRAVAAALAARGATTWLGARSGADEAVEHVREAAGHERVAAIGLELTSAASIDALAARLREEGVRLDVLVLNAGVVPARGRATDAGLDLMFHVNFLANVMLVDALRREGVLTGGAVDGRRPRVVVVGSEAHRSAPPLVREDMGRAHAYGTGDVMRWYGHSKRYLHTWVVELSRRLRSDDIAVHHLCPGAVASSIAREAPGWSQPLLRVVMRAFFQSPEQAARPVVYLACASALEGETGVYLHMTERKEPAAETRDPDTGAWLWDAAHELADRVRREER